MAAIIPDFLVFYSGYLTLFLSDAGQSPVEMVGTERSQPMEGDNPGMSLTRGNERHSMLLIADDTHATKPHT